MLTEATFLHLYYSLGEAAAVKQALKLDVLPHQIEAWLKKIPAIFVPIS
jgi:hypothetical protein